MYLTRNQAYGFRTEGSNPSLSARQLMNTGPLARFSFLPIHSPTRSGSSLNVLGGSFLGGQLNALCIFELFFLICSLRNMLAKMGGYGYHPITVSTDEIAGIDQHSAEHHGDIDLSRAVFVRPPHTNTFCPT